MARHSDLWWPLLEETAIRDSAYNGARQAARRIRDWEALEAAVDAQMSEQAAFVEWWEGAVGKNWGGDRSKYAHLHTCALQEAEELTGIRQPQVSRWRKRLARHGHTSLGAPDSCGRAP